jgi:hypothetical protein
LKEQAKTESCEQDWIVSNTSVKGVWLEVGRSVPVSKCFALCQAGKKEDKNNESRIYRGKGYEAILTRSETNQKENKSGVLGRCFFKCWVLMVCTHDGKIDPVISNFNFLLYLF